MSSYPNTLITNAGLDLIAEANAQGEALIFTKVKLGDGSLPEGQSIQTMTALISPKLESELTSGSVKNGQAKLRFSVENSGLDEGFFAREVGVFAKVGEEGTETLYAYTNGGNYVDYIPNKDVPIDAQIMDVYIVAGNAATVQIQVDSAAYATVLDLEEHNTGSDSHPLTIDDTVAPTSDSAPMPAILNNIATMLKSISGETGWKSVPAKSLASLVASLSTGITVAADGTFSNPTLGISGLMAQNGYICFGKNFGGLILQWGCDSFPATNVHISTVTYPLTFSTYALTIAGLYTTDTANTSALNCISVYNQSVFSCKINVDGHVQSNIIGITWFAIGR